MNMKIVTIIISITTLLTSGVIMGVTKDENKKEVASSIETLSNEIDTTYTNAGKYEKNNSNNAKTKERYEKSITDVQEESKIEVQEEKSTNYYDKVPNIMVENNSNIQATNNAESKTSETPKPAVDENATTGDEGMLNKYGVTDLFVITEKEFIPAISGYATTKRYATFNFAYQTMIITERTEIKKGEWDSLSDEEKIVEGPRVKETSKTYKLSDEEAQKVADIYNKLLDYKSSYDEESLANYRDDMFTKQILEIWDYSEDGSDDYYYSVQFEDGPQIGYVFDNIKDVRFLKNLLSK